MKTENKVVIANSSKQLLSEGAVNPLNHKQQHKLDLHK
jgi:hypothetical protein